MHHHGKILKQLLQDPDKMDDFCFQMSVTVDTIELLYFAKEKFEESLISKICGRMGWDRTHFIAEGQKKKWLYL